LLASTVKAMAHALGIPLVWGGDWVSFVDCPHFELPRHFYPDPPLDFSTPEKATIA
jgi:peptidoglycan L-alanyl-D-glutamate endopeptidase CwlK